MPDILAGLVGTYVDIHVIGAKAGLLSADTVRVVRGRWFSSAVQVGAGK
jgi:hypothetical protein